MQHFLRGQYDRIVLVLIYQEINTQIVWLAQKSPLLSPLFIIASVGGLSTQTYLEINWIVQWKLFWSYSLTLINNFQIKPNLY